MRMRVRITYQSGHSGWWGPWESDKFQIMRTVASVVNMMNNAPDDTSFAGLITSVEIVTETA